MVNNTLAPGLLLAAPRLGDPNFERTVILLGRHEPEGALGWVLNGRSLGRVDQVLRASNLVPAGSDVPATAAFEGLARVGGPVGTSTGWMVYRRAPGLMVPGEIEVGGELGVSANSGALAAVLRGDPPVMFRLIVGYAGWGPAQLDGEVREGAWLPASVDAQLVFEVSNDALWDAAYERAIGTGPGAFMSGKRGQA